MANPNEPPERQVTLLDAGEASDVPLEPLTVEVLMDVFGMDRHKAEACLAMERGENEGCCIDLAKGKA